MKADVRTFVRECDTFENKSENLHPAELLQPLLILNRACLDISMDFIEGLPLSNGLNVILVVVDRLTKHFHFIALSHSYTALTIAQLFTTLKLHGLPCSIVSDRDPIFLSNFWTWLFTIQGITLAHSSAYHLQTDGQTKIVNKCVGQYLRCYCGEKPKSWSLWLSIAKWWYNSSYHSFTKMTPFEALYSYPPPNHIHYIPNTTQNAAIASQLRSRAQILETLKHNLQAA